MKPDPRRDAGSTLVELVVGMSVLGVLLVVAGQAQISIARDTGHALRTADRAAAVRLAVDTLDRQIRSADYLATDTAVGCAALSAGTSCVRLSSQYQGRARCGQWQVLADPSAAGTAYLRMRQYSPAWATNGDVDPWRTLAQGLRLPGSGAPPFTVTTAGGGSTTLDVALTALDPTGRVGAATISVSFAPRGLLYSTGSSSCSGLAP